MTISAAVNAVGYSDNGTQGGVWTTRTTGKVVKVTKMKAPGFNRSAWLAGDMARCCCEARALQNLPASQRDRQSQGASFIAVGLGGVVQNRWGVQKSLSMVIDFDNLYRSSQRVATRSQAAGEIVRDRTSGRWYMTSNIRSRRSWAGSPHEFLWWALKTGRLLRQYGIRNSGNPLSSGPNCRRFVNVLKPSSGCCSKGHIGKEPADSRSSANISESKQRNPRLSAVENEEREDRSRLAIFPPRNPVPAETIEKPLALFRVYSDVRRSHEENASNFGGPLPQLAPPP